MAVYVAEHFHKNTLIPKKKKGMLNPLNNSLSKGSTLPIVICSVLINPNVN